MDFQSETGRIFLEDEYARQIRAEGKKARLTCSYAAAWFPKHPEYADLVTDGFLE